ncbi:MAG: hypothetical protein V4659_04430 [Pseudomonadota bacterium]
MKSTMIALGAVLELVGLLWIGQGLGVVRWPASSFMIDQSNWAALGVALVAVGTFLMWKGLRRPA